MRVLWIDADDNPWTDASGWRVLQDFGVEACRVSSLAEAQPLVAAKDFDLVLVRAEQSGAPEFLARLRRELAGSARKLIVASSEWSKEQFRVHSQSGAAADRYARVPMPPEGFLNLVADLFGCPVEGLADFSVDAEKAKEAKVPTRRARKAIPAGGPGDIEVLKKYLALREEQLEIAESERDEVAKENERLQKEAQLLQLRLREFEHMHEELEKKLSQMENEKTGAEARLTQEKEEGERNEKANQERVKALEAQLGEAEEKFEGLRSRVRKDIRKIRENERELEARLELSRKDTETLLQARDQKVLELQRKIDALEFDLDQVQDSRVQAQLEAERYLAKLSRVSRALQIAHHVIEDDLAAEAELDDLEPELGGAAQAEEAAAVPEVPAAAEPPPPEEPASHEHELSPEVAALANDGAATQMINAEHLNAEQLETIGNSGGESSSSG